MRTSAAKSFAVEERSERRTAVVVALITFATFATTLSGRFLAWDDQANFLTNPFFRGFSAENLRWMWTTHLLGHYVPLSWMSLALDYELWGMNPVGYHLTNVLLHAVTAAAAFYVILAVLRSMNANRRRPDLPRFGAAFAALLFALHPLRVESVAWITERRDVLSLLLALVSMLAFFKAEHDEARWRHYLLSLAAFAAALLAKASVVPLPVVLLILGFHPMGWALREGRVDRTAVRRLVGRLAPFFVLSLLAGVGSIVALEAGPQLSIPQKVAVTTYALGFYITKTIAPTGLAALYEMPPTFHPMDARYWPSYLVAITTMIAALIAARRWRGIGSAMLVFVAVSLPMLGVVQNGPTLAADRYTYHSGIALAALAGAAFIVWPRWTKMLMVAESVTVAVLAVLTIGQTRYWHDSSALWSRVIDVDPESAMAHNSLGVHLAEQGNSQAAVDEYRRALELNPHFADPHNNLGYELAKMGHVGEAVSEFRAALSIQPRMVDAEVNWGNVLFAARQFDGAIAHYARATTIAPTHAGAHFNWAMALAAEDRKSDAIVQLETAAKLDPTDADTRHALDELKGEDDLRPR